MMRKLFLSLAMMTGIATSYAQQKGGKPEFTEVVR